MGNFFDISQFDSYKEDNRREVKRANGGLPNDMWETYSAYANTYGGVIILGVKELDDKHWRTTGLKLKDKEKLLDDLWNLLHNRNKVNINLLTESDVQTYDVGEDIIIVITVPVAKRSEKPVYINNDMFNQTFRRSNAGDYKCTRLQVKAMLRDQTENTMDMEILDERFRSRFEWGLIADITLPDYETRMAILHKKEELEGYNISEEVIKYIATNIKSNIRELEGAFNKVMASSKLEKKEVTLELAEQALKDIISPDEQKVITPDYIISVVAEHYHVTVADLCGNKRSSKIVMPRQIAMYLCRDIIDTSLKTIGKNLGDRDHTTVMHGIEKIENELKTNDNLKNSIDTLRKKINPQG